jgi:hypothetical protein
MDYLQLKAIEKISANEGRNRCEWIRNAIYTALWEIRAGRGILESLDSLPGSSAGVEQMLRVGLRGRIVKVDEWGLEILEADKALE